MIAMKFQRLHTCLRNQSWKIVWSAPQAEKSRWRHIQLAIKPRYLGNHESQIKRCNGTLSGSHGRSLRIRHEKSPQAPPGGGLMMTSYPVGNKTSLSRKRMHPRCKVTTERYQEVRVALSQSVIVNRLKRPLVEKLRWRHIRWAIKPRYLGNVADNKLLWITIMKSWSFSNLKKQQISIQKTYQFMNAVNGVSHSHKTANTFFIWLSCIEC